MNAKKSTFKVFLLVAAATTCIINSPALFAHGGVSMDDDMCVMRLDRYKAHFTGYQPERRATQEFCEDIPEVGKSIFVIDFISDELRGMETDFRIVKDVNAIGRKAQYSDLGTPEDIKAATLHYVPYQHYKHGTISINYEFKDKGAYIGIVTAKDPDSREVFRSVFPFEVGIFRIWKILGPVVAVLIFSAVIFTVFLSRIQKSSKETAQTTS